MALGVIFNSERLMKALKKVPKSVHAEVNKAIRKDAQEWVATAKMLAPEDPVGGTYLKPSIRHEESPTGGQIVRAGGKDTTRDSVNGPRDYAVIQEFGREDMAPSPFFWTSFRLLKKRFVMRRKRAMNKAIREFNNG